MRLSFKEWVSFVLVALLGLGLWYKFAYPQFSVVDLRFDKRQAVEKAKWYLESIGAKVAGYSIAVVFNSTELADTYLQKTLGPEGREKFIKQQGYELFFWRVRFFKELQKEEYALEISSKSGKILSFNHFIEDIEARPTLEKEAAKKKAENFLVNVCKISLDDFDFHRESVSRYDKRIDYSFSWEKKGVYVPWKSGLGGAKLLSGVTVSGDEIKGFHLGAMDIPEHFRRHIDKQSVLGEYLSRFSYLLFITLIVLSMVTVLRRRQSVIMQISKKWYVGLAIFLSTLNVTGIFNNFQQVLNNYPTSVSFNSYVGIYFLQALTGALFLSVIFITPGIAGESLLDEVFPKSWHKAFTPFLRSTFLGRSMSSGIFLGYIVFFVMLGFQAVLFYLGQKYLGVWKQWFKLTQFSTAYIPFFSAFTTGITASLLEEIIFRVFGIGWLRKYLKSTVWAIVLSSLVWGFGHTQYAVFPVWFRGIEVSLLGIFLGFIFIGYGLIPLIVAHYLFDVFWGVADFILGTSTPYLFIGSLAMMALPLGFGVLAFFFNRPEEAREINFILSAAQEYNLQVLIVFVSQKKLQGLDQRELKEKLIRYGWDHVLVELAIGKVFADA